MKTNLKIFDTVKTYNFLWKKHMMGRRIILPRYGDGEYLIMKGRKGVIATHKHSDRLTDLLNKSLKRKSQIICMPTTSVGCGGVRGAAADYFIENSGHTTFVTGIWRLHDVQYDFNLLTEFFVEKTLVVTGNHDECQKAFENNNNVDTLAAPRVNAFSEYDSLKEKLTSVSRQYESIVFALGPTANILIGDLIGCCRSHLIDIGSFLGIIINPYSKDENLIKKWTGIPKRSNKETARKYSKKFFKKLNDKIELYRE
jgi:hypothetical protein